LSEAHWSRIYGPCISIASLCFPLVPLEGGSSGARSHSVSPSTRPRLSLSGSVRPTQSGPATSGEAGRPSWRHVLRTWLGRSFPGRVGNQDTPNRLEPRLSLCACMARMAADNAHRSSERSVGVMCRMSAAEREELKHLAHAAGCSVQTYIMSAVFGRTEVRDLPRGRPTGAGDNRPPSLGQRPDD
jgi:hypothetical protein